MTTTAIPLSTQLPCGPDRIEVAPMHLSVTGVYDNGVRQNVHVLENDDLGVMLHRGQRDHRGERVPYDHDNTGIVVVSLGVDEDHDEIHYSARAGVETEEILSQSIEALIMARDAVRQVTRGVRGDRS